MGAILGVNRPGIHGGSIPCRKGWSHGKTEGVPGRGLTGALAKQPRTWRGPGLGVDAESELMAYHVRIAATQKPERTRWGNVDPKSARALRSSYGFNLTDVQVRQQFALPWETDARIFAGNRVFDRSEAGIWVYEAPPIDVAERRADHTVSSPAMAEWRRGRDWQDLAWREVTRAGRDVTRQFISGRTGKRTVTMRRAAAVAGAVVAAASPALVGLTQDGGSSGEKLTLPIDETCSAIGGPDVSRALGVPDVQAAPRRHEPRRQEGDSVTCDYLEYFSRRVVFVIQADDITQGDDATNATKAQQRVEEAAGKPVPGVGDAARYEQGAVASTMVLAKGQRVIRLTSQSQPLPEHVMVELGRKVVQRQH